MNNITNYYGDLGIFLYYTPIVSAFMAAFALLANRRRTPSQTWLALVLVTFGTGMAASFLFDRYFSASHSEIFRPVNFIFSTANSIVILFYYVSLMRPQLLTRKYMLYFSGGWVLFSLFVLLPGTFSARFQPVQGIHRLADLSSLPMVFHLLTICCILVFYTWMGVFILRIYRDYRKLFFCGRDYPFVGEHYDLFVYYHGYPRYTLDGEHFRRIQNAVQCRFFGSGVDTVLVWFPPERNSSGGY